MAAASPTRPPIRSMIPLDEPEALVRNSVTPPTDVERNTGGSFILVTKRKSSVFSSSSQGVTSLPS